MLAVKNDKNNTLMTSRTAEWHARNKKKWKKSHFFFLFQKSELKSRGMGIQSFFDPFSGHLWVCILVAYVMVSIFMFVIGRVTPYERHAPQDGKGNTLTLANSFWFTLSAFFFRSTTISPKVRHYFFLFSKSCKHSLFGRLEN